MTKRAHANSLKWSVLGLSIASILFSLLLVYSPVVDAFGGASANCSDGTTVSCSGYRCSGTDNVGCSCTNENGTQGEKKSCPKHQKRALPCLKKSLIRNSCRVLRDGNPVNERLSVVA